MAETDNAKLCHKINRISDVRIVCEPTSHVFRLTSWETPYGSDEYYKRLERGYREWIKEFHDFIRDHRSQDPVSLDVEIDREDICSRCFSSWEPDEDGTCAHCGGKIEAKEGARHEN